MRWKCGASFDGATSTVRYMRSGCAACSGGETLGSICLCVSLTALYSRTLDVASTAYINQRHCRIVGQRYLPLLD